MNLCSRNSPYSLNCHVGAMLVFRMLCKITQSSDAHRTESVTAMDHDQTMGVNSKVLHTTELQLRTSTCFSEISVMINGTSWLPTPLSNFMIKRQLSRTSCNSIRHHNFKHQLLLLRLVIYYIYTIRSKRRKR